MLGLEVRGGVSKGLHDTVDVMKVKRVYQLHGGLSEPLEGLPQGILRVVHLGQTHGQLAKNPHVLYDI